MPPDVSVVIPTFQRPQRLEQAVRAVLAQEGVDLEVVVVHDGPHPGADLRDPRVRVVALDRRSGSAAARNAGLEAARGTWVAFLDDDDLWAPWKLRGQLEAAAASDAGFVYSGVVTVDERLRPLSAFPVPDPADVLDRLLERNAIPAGASNVMVRREPFAAMGGFDTSFAHLPDWDAWIRIASELPAAADPREAVAYVLHPGNMSLAPRAELAAEGARLRDRYAPLARERGVRFDEAFYDHWVAGRQRSLSAARLYLTSGLRHRSPVNVLRGVRAATRLPTPRRHRPSVPWL